MSTAAPSIRLGPTEIARDTYVIHNTYRGQGAPVAVSINAMVIRGQEPVVVDTGAPIHRDSYLEDLFSLVDPLDVRWVFISHEDADHTGNLHQVMAACPNATLVANWFMCERMAAERLDVPPTRWCWRSHGESLDVGDRTLLAIRPPLYDSPTTRGLFDPTTGVYWASDCYATPVPDPVGFVQELDQDFWQEGFTMFQAWNSPWVTMVDPSAYQVACGAIEALNPTAIGTAHGPNIAGGPALRRAHYMLRQVPEQAVPPQPGQPMLEELLAAARS